MYAISRLRSPGGFGYRAVHFRRRGRGYAKSFYDVRRGGARQALADAIAWRNRKLENAGVLSMREFREILRSDNRSGVPGVFFTRPRFQPQGVYQAKMRLPGGRQITRKFAVRKYGKKRSTGPWRASWRRPRSRPLRAPRRRSSSR